MKEILILSGKGGTGKTTICASLATLVPDLVLADCDVDAPDLHLLLEPVVRQENQFWSGVEAVIDADRCTGCGTCYDLCRFEAITMGETAAIAPFRCEGCGVCAVFCPDGAIDLEEKMCGLLFYSDTPHGPLVHARLGVGEENSGKLVAQVKRESRETAGSKEAQWILVDGPPGIGCPVIASMSGADFALLISEPTRSGLHDLLRVKELADHFKVPCGVVINKWDLHAGNTKTMVDLCLEREIPVVGRIPFDRTVIEALVKGRILTEYTPDSLAALAVRDLWLRLTDLLAQQPSPEADRRAAI